MERSPEEEMAAQQSVVEGTSAMERYQEGRRKREVKEEMDEQNKGILGKRRGLNHISRS